MSAVELWRKPRTMQVAGYRHSKFQNDIADGLFSPPVKNGRTSLWPSNEVEILRDARIAGLPEDQIRALVADLIKQRARAMAAAA